MSVVAEDPTQQRCPRCDERMKLMETRKNSPLDGAIRRRFACLRGCGHTLHTVQHAPFRLEDMIRG